MMKYSERSMELTPQLFPPTALRLQWSLHLLSYRDHALWRLDAHVGTTEDRVGLYMGPCPGPQEASTLQAWAARQITSDIAVGLRYLAEPPEPFPVSPSNGRAPAA